jgi:hypothetical protein
VLAAGGTIWATIISANREIKASQAQTAAAQKQEQDRLARETSAFHAVLEAAMTRVLAEAAWARNTYPQTFLPQTAGADSVEAYAVRQCITKGAFAELRTACVRRGYSLTGDFLDLEREIDSFALQVGTYAFSPAVTMPVQKGKHGGLGDQLAKIEAKATQLRDKARDGQLFSVKSPLQYSKA